MEKYAQSRSLGLLLFVVLIGLSTVLAVLLMELGLRRPTWWLAAIVILSLAGVSVLGLWLVIKVLPKYERRLYSKEGQIELQQKKVSIWAFVAYVVAFLAPIALNAEHILPTRWALPLALVSLGVFAFYASGKEKQRPLGAVFCAVLLVEAAVTAAGVPTPFFGKGWLYCCFVALMIYIAGASLITAVVVHIYNRKILRKIKEVRPFGEQEANKSDT
ncbi:hypothetical protein ES703_113330 [subsurface metagenome]